MPSIEDYALIGDCETAALVSREGSIDWLCFPRFDSPACFAARVGTLEHGRWLLAPCGEIQSVRRQYLGDTPVLETEFTTLDGVVAVIDFMPVRSGLPGSGANCGRAPRKGRDAHGTHDPLDYGSVVPWGVYRTAVRTVCSFERVSRSQARTFARYPGLPLRKVNESRSTSPGFHRTNSLLKNSIPRILSARRRRGGTSGRAVAQPRVLGATP